MAEPAVASAPAEPSGTMDSASLDAILNQMAPMPDGAADVGPALVDPAAPAVAPVPPVAPSAPVAPAAPAPTAAPVVDDPFVPPPSVLEPPAAVDPAAGDDPYGTMPEEPPASIKSEKNKEEYHKWRESHEKLKKDLRSTLEELKKQPQQDPGLLAQIEDLTKRNAEQNSIIERIGAEHLPYVQTRYNEPRKAAIKDAEKALTLARLDPQAIAGILALPEIDRVAALDDIYEKIDSESLKKKLSGAIDKIDVIDAEKAEFLNDREGNVKAITEAEAAENSRRFQEQEKLLKSNVDATIEHFAEKLGFEFLRKSDQSGYEKWNERVDRDIALIHELAITNKDPQRFLAAIVAGVSGPHYRIAWQNQLKANVELKAENARLKGVVPNLNGKPPADPGGAAGADGMDADLVAAGVTPEDDLATVSRKLGAYMTRG